MANIVCKKCFLFQVEIKKKCYWKCWLSPSNRPNQQIKPYPTRWHYPLITYLTLTCSSIIESISENEINQHDMEHSLIFILFKETLDIHKYFVWIYIDSDGLKIEHQSRDIHIECSKQFKFILFWTNTVHKISRVFITLTHTGSNDCRMCTQEILDSAKGQ